MEKKKRKQRSVRSQEQRIRDMERKVAEMKAKQSVLNLRTAVKDGAVSDENVKEYKRHLRYLKVIEKSPAVFIAFGMEDEASSAAVLRDKIIAILKGMVTAGGGQTGAVKGKGKVEEVDDEDDEDEDEDEDDDDDEDEDDEDDEDDDDDDEDDEEEEG